MVVPGPGSRGQPLYPTQVTLTPVQSSGAGEERALSSDKWPSQHHLVLVVGPVKTENLSKKYLNIKYNKY